jgi:acetylornithine deacetylase/succinyl-diaminopimelate desuccinylase-like protein
MKDERVLSQIRKNKEKTIAEMQKLIQQASVSTENLGITECAELIRDYFREFGCSQATLAPTDGNPVVFASYNANASKTLIIYLWYDTVSLMDGWSSPALEGRVSNFPPYGKCVIGRGAFTKGSLVAFVEAMRSLREVRGELPLNLKFAIEGEEILSSRNLPQFVERNANELQKADGALFPRAAQETSGQTRLTLGSKGMIQFDLVASGKRWGRGPQESECHSAEKAWIDSPLWRLLHALSTLTDRDQQVKIPGFRDGLVPPSKQDLELVTQLEKTFNIQEYAEQIHVAKFAYDKPPRELLSAYLFSPTLNVANLTGAKSNFAIPARASARLEIRYLPDQNAQDQLAKVRKYLDSQGYPDIDIEVKGIIDCAKTPVSEPLVQSVIQTYKAFNINPEIWPNSVRSSPHNVFSSKLGLPLAEGGLGHGGRHHEPNEYFVVDPEPPYFGLVTCQQSYTMMIDSFSQAI